MLENVISSVLKKVLGRFVQDFDHENLSIGLLRGELTLHELKLRPDVLSFLNLPVEVKLGTAGKVSVMIPWASLFSQPVVVTIEDVYVLVSPVIEKRYDEERESLLLQSAKRAKLDKLEGPKISNYELPTSHGFLENLTATVLQNLQVFLHNVHIRYEDTITIPDKAFACGLCIQSLSAETTSSKWKPAQISASTSSVFKLVRMEACSIYWNPSCEKKNLARNHIFNNNWRQAMRSSLQTFSFSGEEFQFILKPMMCKVKIIMNKSQEARIPKLLLDFVMQDAAIQCSKEQYLCMTTLAKSLQRMAVNRRYRKYRPATSKILGNVKQFWLYAYKAVIHEYIRPHSWECIKQHRSNYNLYKSTYGKYLIDTNDADLEESLTKLEDKLDIANIVLAREHAKIEMIRENPDRLCTSKSIAADWWDMESFWPSEDEINGNCIIISQPKKMLWSSLTPEEKEILCTAIGCHEEGETPDWELQYIEHKLNFTLGNCTVSLTDNGKEIMVATVTQFLTSIETRPAAKAFKISTRTESFVVEGLSEEDDLTSIFRAENMNSGQSYPHVLTIDLEKNPLTSDADIGLTFTLDLIEIIYNENAVSEILSFFQFDKWSAKKIADVASQRVNKCARMGRSVIEHIIQRKKSISVNVEICSPCLVIPALGSLQRGGNVAVIDLGRVRLYNDLQGDSSLLSEATRMELEERLYDRFALNISEVQFIFCDSGESWREYRKYPESEYHIIPKTSCDVVFSNSSEPNYRLLPRQKLNINVPSIKLNVSDRRLRQLVNFCQCLPLPNLSQSFDTVDGNVDQQMSMDLSEVQMELTLNELLLIRRAASRLPRSSRMSIDSGKRVRGIMETLLTEIDGKGTSSNHSDEESEIYARTVDLPGFEDNVSPHSTIRVLLRIVLGELVVHLSRSSNHTDKAYLLLRVEKSCVDVALMDFGPALQATIRSIQLVDKLHSGQEGEYLEMVSTPKSDSEELVTLLYRKVRADCPDFTSHFHNVEQSLVIDFSSVHLIFHLGACIMLKGYLEFLSERLQEKFTHENLKAVSSHIPPVKSLFSTEMIDPPVPSGATKFSYSIRLNEISVKLCDSDLEFAEIKISGAESDCIFKANEKMILRAYLTSMHVEDLTPGSLYPEIFCLEDDKVFELKYIKESSHICRPVDVISSKPVNDKTQYDAHFRLRFGRIHLVYLRKFFTVMQRFADPFLHPQVAADALRSVERSISVHVEEMKSKSLKINLSIELHAPLVLIPQKSDSPNLLVINVGNLSVENFLKELENDGSQSVPVVDNILIRLNSFEVHRAVFSLSGDLEAQESIIEPTHIRVDVKRMVPPVPRDQLSFEIKGGIDMVKVMIGQRDLSTLWTIWKDNIQEGKYAELERCLSHPGTPIETRTPAPTPKLISEDPSIKKLQAFFCHSVDVTKEIEMHFICDGFQLILYGDGEEPLSSPVRDNIHALCKFEMTDASVSLTVNTDGNMQLQAALQSCSLHDTRPDETLTIRRIFQSYSGESKSQDGPISLSMPPMIDMMYKRTHNGDVSVDVIIEKTRLNVSVPFFIALIKFVINAIPSDDKTLNYRTLHAHSKATAGLKKGSPKPTSSLGSTSGYFSIGTNALDNQSAMSMILKLKKPEIVLIADPHNHNSPIVVLRSEGIFDCSKNLGQATVTVTASNLHILSCNYGQRRQTAFVVLRPCDVEFSKNFSSLEEGYVHHIRVSALDFHITQTTIRTFKEVSNEIVCGFSDCHQRPKTPLFLSEQNEQTDMWNPKSIQPLAIVDEPGRYERPSYPIVFPKETLCVTIPAIQIFLEEEQSLRNHPLVLFKASLELDINDWSKQIHGKCELLLEASCYNDNVASWEPLLEPCLVKDGVYRPWGIIIKVFQGKAHPISCRPDNDGAEDTVDSVSKRGSSHYDCASNDSSTSDEDDSDIENGMIKISSKERNVVNNRMRRTLSIQDSNRIVGYIGDSDSEPDDGALEKIAMAFGHMFSGGSSDDGSLSEGEEGSSDELRQKAEAFSDSDYVDGAEIQQTKRANFKTRKDDSTDSGLETGDHMDKKAVYLFIDSRDILDISLTQNSIVALKRILKHFTAKPDEDMVDSGCFNSVEREFSLINQVGPRSKVTVLKKVEGEHNKSHMMTVATALFEDCDSRVSTPASATHFVDDLPSYSDDDLESIDAGFSISSSVIHEGRNSPILESSSKYEEDSVSSMYKNTTKERIEVEVEGFTTLQVLMPLRATSKLHTLNPMRNNIRYHVVVDVKLRNQTKSVIVRSPLQIHNYTCHTINLFYCKSVLTSIGFDDQSESTNPFSDTVKLTTLEPNDVYNVPVIIAYHCKLFAQPAFLDGYVISEKGMWWQELKDALNIASDFTCVSKQDGQTSVFAYRVLCEPNHIFTISSQPSQHTSGGNLVRVIPNYTLHLYPPVTFHNHLPYSSEIRLSSLSDGMSIGLEAGEQRSMYFLDLKKINLVNVEVSNYLGIPWSGVLELSQDVEDCTVPMATDYDTDGGNKQLGLSIKIIRDKSLDVFLHAPYWIINKTGLPLQLRGSSSSIVYESSLDSPILFRFKKHRKKKLRLRVYDSSWSSNFSIDTIGNSGLIVCKCRQRQKSYSFLSTITASHLQYTKVVTFLPCFLIANATTQQLRFMEDNDKADLWMDLGPGQCTPFWPDTSTMKMFVKYQDSQVISQHFSFKKSHKTVLRMDKGSALCVEVSGGVNSSITSTFRTYTNGDAIVRVDNMCEDLFLKLNQKSLGQVTILSKYQSLLYTWDDPTEERVLMWNVYNRKTAGLVAKFNKDGFGKEKVSFHTLRQVSTTTSGNAFKKVSPNNQNNYSSSSTDNESDSNISDVQKSQGPTKRIRKDKVIVYWVSYMEGRQRVLLFTQDDRVSRQARKMTCTEKSDVEFFVSLNFIGLSLVNSMLQELAYISVSSSAAIWEVQVAHKWQYLSLELASWLEDRWKSEQIRADMKDYVHVDFEKMQMTKPFFGELKRTTYPAIWLHYRRSAHQNYLHFRVHRVQIDNQLYDAVFPVVFSTLPIPPHVIKQTGLKPCIDMVSLWRSPTSSHECKIYRFVKLLVQEFSIKVDKGFLLSLYDIFTLTFTPEEENVAIRADIKNAYAPLSKTISLDNSRQTFMVEYAHISPLKFHFSFSPCGSPPGAKRTAKSDIFEFLLNSVGATLTETKDSEFKIPLFEIRGTTLSNKELKKLISSNYTSNVLQQFYVVVLGLEVLGNPHKLVRDFTKGLGDMFYEPLQGVLDSPEEFSYRVAIGAQSLLGHVVGGVAGSLSSIFGSVGHLMTNLSFDEDYKKKRKLWMQKRSPLPQTLVNAGRTFALGLMIGLSGVVVKPVSGSHREGIEGFLKGVGKGLLGLVTKPAAGVVDGVALIMDGVKRAFELGEEVIVRTRLPRFVNPYTGLRPYSPSCSRGLFLLHSVNGQYYMSDVYWAHAPLSLEERADIALITTHHIFLLSRCRLWGGWEAQWTVALDDVTAMPTVAGDTLVIRIREDSSPSVYSEGERQFHSTDTNLLQWLKGKIDQVLILGMEEKTCPAVGEDNAYL